MPITPPIAPDQASPSVREAYQQIEQAFGGRSVPIEYQMMGQVEPFLCDSYTNYLNYVHEGSGSLDTRWREAIVLATSAANNCKSCVKVHVARCHAVGWSEREVAELLAVTATCAMNNTVYKFQNLAKDEQLKRMPSALRADTLRKTSLEPALVELISVVVSAINGCAMCTDAHLAQALDAGLTRPQIDEAVKISAVMTAFNTYFRIQ